MCCSFRLSLNLPTALLNDFLKLSITKRYRTPRTRQESRSVMTRIELSSDLLEWIDKNIPDLSGIQTVKLYSCERLPFEWLAGRNSKPSGVTIANRIYIRSTLCPINSKDYSSLELLFHELVHVVQFRKNRLIHPLQYVWKLWRKGYWDHPMEQEARDRASELAEKYLASK